MGILCRAPSCPVCEEQTCRYFAQVDKQDYWRCKVCEATFLDPLQRPDRARENAEYRLHQNDVHDAGYCKFLSRLSSPLLERLAPKLHGLDYGCGPGPALVNMLGEAGHSMTFYDPLFFNDPSPLTKRYDFITCSEVAEHFHRPAEEFCLLDGMLKPGGLLAVMTTFQTDDKAFARWHYRRDPTHVVFYREVTFERIAARHGWGCEFPAANVALLSKAKADAFC